MGNAAEQTNYEATHDIDYSEIDHTTDNVDCGSKLTIHNLLKAAVKGAMQGSLIAVYNSAEFQDFQKELVKDIWTYNHKAHALRQHAECSPDFESVMTSAVVNHIWPEIHHVLCDVKDIFSNSEGPKSQP